MPLRAKIILAIIIGLISVAVISVVVWGVTRVMQQQEGTPTDQTATVTPSVTPTPSPEPIANPNPIPVMPPPKSSESDIIALVMPFVEGLGTYSNQSNYQNLRDLEPVMTVSMKQWAEGNISEAQKKPFNPLYTGTTTKALAYEFVTPLADNATTTDVKVSTQRKESVGTSANFKVYNQDVVVTLVKQNGQWLVNDAVWQETAK